VGFKRGFIGDSTTDGGPGIKIAGEGKANHNKAKNNRTTTYLSHKSKRPKPLIVRQANE
jgi:hypothetical protein